MSDYYAGYSAGEAAGESAGREEAFNEVDEAEIKCLSSLIADQPALCEGIKDAQNFLNSVYGSSEIQKHVDGDKINLAFRSWKTLWLTKNDVRSVDKKQIEQDALSFLQREFFQASSDFSGEDLKNVAELCLSDLAEQLGLIFNRGHAAALFARLQPDDYYKIGFLGQLHLVATNICDQDFGDIIKNDPQLQNRMIENYAKFLEKALEQSRQQVASHIGDNAQRGFDSARQKRCGNGNSGPQL